MFMEMEWRDGKTAETDDGFPSPADSGCSFQHFSYWFSSICSEKNLPAQNKAKKTSGMALLLYSQLFWCCRLFNNLLMTVINNISGLQTAGI